MNKIFLVFNLFSFLLFANVYSISETRLLRFPAIHKNQVVFTYAGDLYTVDANGGTARKLTNHEGYEMFPRFSPDGSQIAFTGQYDGNTEVYIIPSEGGEPKRLTYTATLSRDDVSDRMGPNNIVLTWGTNGDEIIYRSRQKSYNSFIGQLFSVSPNGEMSNQLPFTEGGFCSYSPNGNKLAMNRVFREFRTWKHYKGGMADDIWIFNFETKQLENITNNPHQDIIPMWHNEFIFFLSDRDGRMNLYAYNTVTKETTQKTMFTEFDIKFPSIGTSQIVFEKGGDIYKYSISNNSAEKIPIVIYDDFSALRSVPVSVSDEITHAHLSPNGERALFCAHGDIFDVPANEGITFNITQTSGAHEREAVWSPNGKYIAYVSDKSGEYELYIKENNSSNEAKQITRNTKSYIYNIKWSPNSKYLLWNDRKFRLNYTDVESGKTVTVLTSGKSVIDEFNWSANSKWITYSDYADNWQQKVYIFNIDKNKAYAITDGMYHASQPNFSDDDKYLVFALNRVYKPNFSDPEWNVSYNDMGKIYLLPLNNSVENPLAPKNDKVSIDKNGDEQKDKNKSDNEPENIDVNNIKSRLIELPVKPGNYSNIHITGNKVYYFRSSNVTDKSGTYLYDLAEKEEKEVGESVKLVFSDNHKKVLAIKSNSYAITDIPAGSISFDKSISLTDMIMRIDYTQEWKQIFYESWRQVRDFFYANNMHGYDWEAIRDKYAIFLPYVKTRKDLTYVIGEMISELNIGHAYVNSPASVQPKKISMGLLGAEISKDESTGYFKIEKILNAPPGKESPLKTVGINIHEGDYILKINNIDLKTSEDIYSHLIGLANKNVLLTVNTKPELSGSRDVVVKPISDELPLYYYEWVQNNMKRISEATNGQVGYIHIPDMLSDGLNEYMQYYLSQLDKKALIIDARGNGGGNVSPMLIDRLNNELIRLAARKGTTVPVLVPTNAFYGPKILLVDKYTASDGDLFAYAFKKFEMGKLIGTRTWGGVVGIASSRPFVDGGQLRVPEVATYSNEVKDWIIEGIGVEPDIVIDNNPYDEYSGTDAQLNKAIELILKELENYTPVAPIPAPPVKTINR